MTGPASVLVRTMNKGTSRQFDRAYLYCPNGHLCVSTPVTTHTGRRLLDGDYTDEWCGNGSCEYREGL